MNTKYVNRIVIFVFLTSILGFLKSAASQDELENHLKKYLELTESQKTTRVFKFADGYPIVSMYALTDQDSMLWFAIYNPAKYYVFTGTGFIDVLATNKLAMEDSIASHLQTDDKTPYLVGKKAIYKWLGYKLQAYIWPSNDRILEAYIAGDDEVYICGERGYGILSSNGWNYYHYKGFTLRKGDKYVDSMFSKEQRRLIWIDQVAGKEDSLRIAIIEKGNRNVSFIALGAHGIEPYNWLLNEHDYKGNLIFALRNGKNIYSLKKKDNHIKQTALPKGIYCSSISKFQKQVVVITENNSKENWIVNISQLNIESLQMILLKSIKPTYSESMVKTYLGIYYLGDLNYIHSVHNDYFFYGNKIKDLNILNFDTLEVMDMSFNENIIWSEYNRNGQKNSIDLVLQDPKFPDSSIYRKIEFDNTGTYSKKDIATLRDIEFYQIMFSFLDSSYLYYADTQGLNRLPLSGNVKRIIEAKSFGKYSSALVSSNNPNSYISDFNLYNLDNNLVLVQRQLDNDIASLIIYSYSDNQFRLLHKYSEKFKPRTRNMLNFQEIFYYGIDYQKASIDFRHKRSWYSFESPTLKIVKASTTGNFYLLGETLLFDKLHGNIKTINQLQKTEYYIYDKWNFIRTFKPSTFTEYRKTPNSDLPIFDAVLDYSSGILYVQGRKDLMYSMSMTRYNDIGRDIVDSVYISSPGSIINMRYPTFSYNLTNGKIKLHPHWLTVLQNSDGKLYVIYKDRPGESGKISIRSLVNGEAKSNTHDADIPWDDYKSENIDQKRMNNNLLLRMGNRIYYLENGKWYQRLVPELENYTDVFNGITIGNTIYLGLDSKIMKILADGTCFTYGENEGIPQGDIRLVSYKDKIFINTGSAIYEFHEPEQNARIVLSGFSAKDKLVTAKLQHSFDYKANSFRFPVYILNTLYPEKCILEYQLKGFNDTPVRIPFTKEIRFDNLKPGSYSFSYTSTTETGQKVSSPVVKFVILPPYYATWWAYLIYVGMGSAAIYGIFKLRTRQLQRRNLALEKTVELRTSELKERQQRIQESIEYASLIQKSILPQREELIQRFRQHFVIWKPRDIVGGDFYWLYVNEAGETFFAVIDCTGHGVPGALLSMTVNSLLDKLVKDGGICSPAEILTRMHREIGAALHQTEAQTQQDGIEIALIKINPSSQTLTFSGGGLHLLHYDPESKVTSHLRGNKHGLGGLKWHAELVFEEQVIPYAEKQRIYLYTDGILDQPVAEAEKLKRLGSVAWLEFLGSIAGLPMEEQETNCNELISRMLACHEQRDDITVVGIEL